jgi:hypothetical protein
MGFSLYSLADTHTTINHPDVGQMVLSAPESGGGRISWSYAGDMSSHTNTASGYVVINRQRGRSGTLTLEVPVNSPADVFLRRLANYLAADSTPTSRFGLTTMAVKDNAANRLHSFSGVTLQKKPDESYDVTAPNRQYNFLFADCVSQ